MTLQKTEFLAGEADAWYQRNADHLNQNSPLRDIAASLLSLSLVKITHPSVLEIGCGRGDNLAALRHRLPIEAFGIEPSMSALEAGRLDHPWLNFTLGTADVLPYTDASFDALWFGFCLYLVDRELLLQCIAQADRVLKDGGTLCIVDFDPDVPSRRTYHHRPGLYSYKMDYSRLFLANPAYCLVQKVSASHSDVEWHLDPQERIGIWLLQKNVKGGYSGQ